MRRVAALLLCVLASSVAAQEPTPIPDKVPVVLDGRVVFEVGEAGTWSPTQRAAEINRILRAAAVDPEPVNLVLSESEGYPTIRMGDWHLLSVTESDVVPGMEMAEQAQRWLQTVEAALLQAREERSAAYITTAWLRVLAALAAALLCTWIAGRASARLPIWLLRRRGGAVSGPVPHKPFWQLAIETVCVLLQIGLWVGAALYAVEQFPHSRQLRYQSIGVLHLSLAAPLFTLSERTYSAIDVLSLLGTIVALWVVVSLFTRLLSQRIAHVTGTTRGTLQPLATIFKYGLIFVGLIVILQMAGLNLSSLAIFASVLGVGIGFGLQSIANNFVSGLILSFERSIKPGDYVTVGELQGTVLRIGARSTVIRTRDRVSIIVPNAQLLEHEVVNWSYGDELARLHLPITVAAGADLDVVRRALLGAAHAHPAVLDDPSPEVRFRGFANNALNLELLVWCSNPAGHGALESDLYFRIEANLRGAGLPDPFPQQTVHLAAHEIAAALAPAPPASSDAAARGDRHGSGDQPEAAPSPPAAPINHGLDIDTLVGRMRGPDGLAIRDRRHLLALHPRCFVGSEAVAWLMRAENLRRDEAVRLGQSLVQRGVFHHVLDEQPFRDGNFFYRFYADE